MIRCSLGTAKVLGLKSVKVDDLPTTAYMMVGDRCKFNCAFCAQARESGSKAGMLSRVTWPVFSGEDVLRGLNSKAAGETLRRICFQVVQDNQALEETKEWVRTTKEHSNLPICVSAGPRSMEEIEELLQLGVDHVSVALDAATSEVYSRIKDGSWEGRFSLLKEAAKRFPDRIATHLIVGLGENDDEMVKLIQDLYDLGITVALFAFTPVKGTRMEKISQPEISRYRRIQAAHYFIRQGYLRAEEFNYNNGSLVGYGKSKTQLKAMLGDGEAFRTSGCIGCNRPYYNETPGEELYNYPRPLTDDELESSLERLFSQLRFESEEVKK